MYTIIESWYITIKFCHSSTVRCCWDSHVGQNSTIMLLKIKIQIFWYKINNTDFIDHIAWGRDTPKLEGVPVSRKEIHKALVFQLSLFEEL